MSIVRSSLLFASCMWWVIAHAAVGVVVETRTFHSSSTGPRVEVNMAILGGTAVTLANQAGFMQARVEALTLIEQNGTIKAFAKTEVLGPERLDSLQYDLLHQEFFDLAPGSYELTIELRDLNSTDTTVTRYHAPLAVGVLPAGVSISDILFAERIVAAPDGPGTKFGYQVVPLLADYFPKSIETLELYAEVYGSETHFGKDSLYLLTYQIEDADKGGVFGQFKKNSRVKAKPVEPVMTRMDIKALPSGNYRVAVEVRDRKGEMVARREQFFQRNNPMHLDYDLQTLDQLDMNSTFAGAFSTPDSLAEHINSLRPIADPLERKIIDDRWKDRDMDQMKRFFYSFWANRSMDPEQAWLDYRAQVIKVNKIFGCRVLKGYETDRGYVYLKYGAPNTMMDKFNEMGTPPYTIWHYYRAGKYTNRRFVFYDTDRVTNCFQLLHSEVPGEIQNPQWNQILHSANQAVPNVQPAPVQGLEGQRVNEYYNDPR